MATDYDAPRKRDDDPKDESLEALKSHRGDHQSSKVDVDETEVAENLELPGADLSDTKLEVRVVPKQTDEFTCSECFLVLHISQLADPKTGMCTDCDG
jgi:hypothetical protein